MSDDGIDWSRFPCAVTSAPFDQCAGWHPVLADQEDDFAGDPDLETLGGDAFDLTEIGVARARLVRITDRKDLKGTFDLDAVAILHGDGL